MGYRALLVVALIVLVGCSRATLPYKPEPQPQGARISAGYQIVGDRIRIEINQHYALQDAVQAHRDLESRKTTGSSIFVI